MRENIKNQPILKAIKIAGSVSALARAINVSPQAVIFWRDDRRSVSPKDCSQIEIFTNGKVTRKMLRPKDWHLIWLELN